MFRFNMDRHREKYSIFENYRSPQFSCKSTPVENDPDNVSALLYAPKRLRRFMLGQLFLKKTGTDAIVVLHNGQIVFESYANGNDEHTPHILMSAT